MAAVTSLPPVTGSTWLRVGGRRGHTSGSPRRGVREHRQSRGRRLGSGGWGHAATRVRKPSSGLSCVRWALPSLGLSFPFCKETELEEKKGSVAARTQALEPAAVSLNGLPWWLSGQESICQCRRHRRDGFDSWVGKIPWSGKKWQPAPVFLPGKSHGQRSLAGYSLGGHKETDTT